MARLGVWTFLYSYKVVNNWNSLSENCVVCSSSVYSFKNDFLLSWNQKLEMSVNTCSSSTL